MAADLSRSPIRFCRTVSTWARSHKGNSYPGKQPAIIDQKLWDQVQDQLKANLQSPHETASRHRGEPSRGDAL